MMNKFNVIAAIVSHHRVHSFTCAAALRWELIKFLCGNEIKKSLHSVRPDEVSSRPNSYYHSLVVRLQCNENFVLFSPPHSFFHFIIIFHPPHLFSHERSASYVNKVFITFMV
jgi:hypothetical protein